MQYDYHGEYPVTLRADPEGGVTGIWYQNQLKPLDQMLKELVEAGQTEEVARIRQFMGAEPIGLEKKLDASRRTRRLYSNAKGLNGLHVVQIVGKAVFEPLSTPNWNVSGSLSVEFEIPNDLDPSLDARYSVHLEAEWATSLSKWNGQAWVRVEEIIIPYNTSMYELFEGRECTTTPVISNEEPPK